MVPRVVLTAVMDETTVWAACGGTCWACENEPSHLRDDFNGCRMWVFTCPGCQDWHVEVPYDQVSEVREGLEWFAVEHRAACPAFDMLAGLQGVVSQASDV